MFSPHLQSLLIEAHVDELRRHYAAAPRDGATHQGAGPLATHLRRLLARLGGRAASEATAPTG
jgi:hypothetical protein